jgi:hypothetical protein
MWKDAPIKQISHLGDFAKQQGIKPQSHFVKPSPKINKHT